MAPQSLFGYEIPNHILKSLISVLTPRFSWSCMIDLHRRQQTVSVDKVAALKVLDFNSSRRHKLSRFVSACSVPIKLNATSKLINRQQERIIVKAVHRISKTRIPKLIKILLFLSALRQSNTGWASLHQSRVHNIQLELKDIDELWPLVTQVDNFPLSDCFLCQQGYIQSINIQKIMSYLLVTPNRSNFVARWCEFLCCSFAPNDLIEVKLASHAVV